jgi:hypothetical protein
LHQNHRRKLITSVAEINCITGCHKPCVVLLYTGDAAEDWRLEVQRSLSWSEDYQVKLKTGMTCLKFLEAIKEPDDDRVLEASWCGLQSMAKANFSTGCQQAVSAPPKKPRTDNF